MLLAQKEHPIRGDWVSEVSKSIEDLGIDLKLEEIRNMTRKCFRKLTKAKILEAAFLELKRKQEKGSKGRTIRYGKSLAMADYLCPNNQLSVQDQRDAFRIRSRTNPLPVYRGNPQLCLCAENKENYHILQCDITNPGMKIDLEVLSNGSLLEMKTTLLQWRESMENLELLNLMDWHNIVGNPMIYLVMFR